MQVRFHEVYLMLAAVYMIFFIALRISERDIGNELLTNTQSQGRILWLFYIMYFNLEDIVNTDSFFIKETLNLILH